MKKLILLSCFFSSMVFAGAPTKYFVKVVETAGSYGQHTYGANKLESVKSVETFRCPGCYRFEVTYDEVEQPVVFNTFFNDEIGDIAVTYPK